MQGGTIDEQKWVVLALLEEANGIGQEINIHNEQRKIIKATLKGLHFPIK